MTEALSKILIVDDTPANVQILDATLRDHARTFFALTGEDALRRLPEIEPDLILLDVMMPEMDGFTVCRALKDDPRFRDIPVIFITALGQAEEESQGLKLGAADYITKPFNPALVLLRVNNHLALRSQRDQLQARTRELEQALARVKVLSGLVPICASCHAIRNDKGFWRTLEKHIQEHSDVVFSHGLCPPCAKKLYPEEYSAIFPDEAPGNPPVDVPQEIPETGGGGEPPGKRVNPGDGRDTGDKGPGS